MKKLILLISMVVILSPICNGQGFNPGYSKEYIGAVNLNTNGGLIGGASFRYSKYLRKKRFRYIAVEVVNVKHPKETKYTNAFSGNTFIYFKSNYLIPIRLQYGRKFLLFKKAPEEGIEVNAIIAGGPTLGWIKPYMIKYDYTTYTGVDPNSNVKVEQFDPNKHTDPTNRILGNASFFSGMDKSEFTIGLNAKAGLSFELPSFGSNITGIEVGALAEIFPRTIVIMPTLHNKYFFTSIYINIFYGIRKD